MTGPARALADAEPLVDRVLARYRERTVAELLRHIPEQSPPYLYDLAGDYPVRPCKGLRGALCLATCEAFGGRPERALNPAVTVEMFHNAFLIHDDIQDGSELRRGLPTLSAAYGVEVALNVGNATNLLGLRRLMANRRELGGELAWRLFEETELMCRQSLEGQAMEIAWIRDNACDLVPADYYRMCLKKTSWYTFLYPCRAGLLVAEGAHTEATRLDRFGWYLGAAFQIQDDVLNLVGTLADYGKEIAGDLWEGKRTLLLIHLLERCTPAERARTERYLEGTRAQRGPGAAEEVRWLSERLTAYGCVESAREAADGLVAAAEREIAEVMEAAPTPAEPSDEAAEAREFLLALPDFVVTRGR
ncbi:polyprenyl synthetase family protein [Kitasatospora sp. CM 4170]|uniref:Polyprenyl synthetase family protein n=1 Tax=Kitasatospora aburaviensis TaxID=67265 RepID=A0ABW1EX02_9ACTN|nr:polyprenyl synthetase family protein [Kitasatospora sp. CM 4170]WNM43984.1 polyprenyl synthetase family protein [Kitasatospora sp. CM 4170]